MTDPAQLLVSDLLMPLQLEHVRRVTQGLNGKSTVQREHKDNKQEDVTGEKGSRYRSANCMETATDETARPLSLLGVDHTRVLLEAVVRQPTPPCLNPGKKNKTNSEHPAENSYHHDKHDSHNDNNGNVNALRGDGETTGKSTTVEPPLDPSTEADEPHCDPREEEEEQEQEVILSRALFNLPLFMIQQSSSPLLTELLEDVILFGESGTTGGGGGGGGTSDTTKNSVSLAERTRGDGLSNQGEIRERVNNTGGDSELCLRLPFPCTADTFETVALYMEHFYGVEENMQQHHQMEQQFVGVKPSKKKNHNKKKREEEVANPTRMLPSDTDDSSSDDEDEEAGEDGMTWPMRMRGAHCSSSSNGGDGDAMTSRFAPPHSESRLWDGSSSSSSSSSRRRRPTVFQPPLQWNDLYGLQLWEVAFVWQRLLCLPDILRLRTREVARAKGGVTRNRGNRGGVSAAAKGGKERTQMTAAELTEKEPENQEEEREEDDTRDVWQLAVHYACQSRWVDALGAPCGVTVRSAVPWCPPDAAVPQRAAEAPTSGLAAPAVKKEKEKENEEKEDNENKEGGGDDPHDAGSKKPKGGETNGGGGTPLELFFTMEEKRGIMDRLLKVLEAAAQLRMWPLQSLCAALVANMVVDLPEEEVRMVMQPPPPPPPVRMAPSGARAGAGVATTRPGAIPALTDERRREVLQKYPWVNIQEEQKRRLQQQRKSNNPFHPRAAPLTTGGLSRRNRTSSSSMFTTATAATTTTTTTEAPK